MIEKFIRKTVIYIWISVAIILAGSALVGWALVTLNKDLPDFSQLEKFEPELSSRVYDVNGVVLKEFFTQRRVFVELDSIPDHLKKALLSTEDRDFYSHWGFNLKRTMKAFMVRYGGASTLTQQVARSLYLSLEKTYVRKLKELLTAVKIELTYTKDEIFEMYLNTVYFGHGVYGVEAASRLYFNKSVRDITTDEAAMLIGILPAPAPYSPINHYDRAIRRRNLVLHNMLRDGFLSSYLYTGYLQDSTKVYSQEETLGIAPYFTEFVRLEISKETEYDIYRDGLEIHTTLDSRLQNFAEASLAQQLEVLQKTLDRRLLNNRDEMIALYRDSVSADISNDSLWNLLPNNEKIVQGAFFAMNPHTGAVRVMIGGRDFKESKFNRTFQGQGRQPGSTFKLVLYTAAIDNGYSPSYQLLNQPVVIINPDGSRWTPNNYDLSTGGLTTLRDAVRNSLNLVSVRVIQNLVTPGVVADYAKKMGFTTYIPRVDAIALGAGSVYLRDLVAAYGILPNHGIYNSPYVIEKVIDRTGKVIYESPREMREVLSQETAYIMTNMLQTVIDNGTGGRIRWYYKFYKPAGGKTGTTNDFTDAWFVGFTDDLVAGTWVGVDDPVVSLGKGQAGGVAALPIWARFMKTTYDSLKWPGADFVRPNGVKEISICSESKKLPTEFCPTETEIFNVKYLPQETCDIHGKTRRSRNNSIDF